MLDPLMSSMSSPVAVPVQTLMGMLVSGLEGASGEMLESAVLSALASAILSALASATTGDPDDEPQPIDPQNHIPAVARPTAILKAPSLSLRFMGSPSGHPSTSNRHTHPPKAR
jgi:hypothetical protein